MSGPGGRQDIEPGTCSACGSAAERGPSGTWWHLGQSCYSDAPGVPVGPATFQPARQQTSPRDRQIREPGRDR